MALERRPHPVARPPFFGRLVDQISDNGDRDPHFVILVDQLGHLHQRA